MLAVGSLQTQLSLSPRRHLQGTCCGRHGTRPWPTHPRFWRPIRQCRGPDARAGTRREKGTAPTGRLLGRGAVLAVTATPCAVSRPPANTRHAPFPTHCDARRLRGRAASAGTHTLDPTQLLAGRCGARRRPCRCDVKSLAPDRPVTHAEHCGRTYGAHAGVRCGRRTSERQRRTKELQ